MGSINIIKPLSTNSINLGNIKNQFSEMQRIEPVAGLLRDAKSQCWPCGYRPHFLSSSNYYLVNLSEIRQRVLMILMSFIE